jgi:O-antigen/teichoic acid export membrane protein
MITKSILIFINFLIQIILTPLFIRYLGVELYGVYVLINKIQGYLALADLRPSAILRYKVTLLINKNDMKNLYEYYSISIVLSFLMFPLMIILSLIFGKLLIHFFNISDKYTLIVQNSILFLGIILGFKSLFAIPDAIIKGLNKEYKAIYIDIVRVVIYIILVNIFLLKGMHIYGIFAAIFISSLFEFLLKYFFVKFFLIPMKFIKFRLDKLKEFLQKSVFYLFSSFVNQLYSSYDIFLIGFFYNMKLVAVYSLTKSLLIRIFESIAIILTGITASIGTLIREKKYEQLFLVRAKVFKYLSSVIIIMMGFFLIFNKTIITLWVGEKFFGGEYLTLFFVLIGATILLCIFDEIFINSFEEFAYKFKIIFISFFIALIFSIIGYYLLSYVGIAMGFLFGKLFQFIYYEKLINNKINFKKSIGYLLFFQNIKIIILISLLYVFIKFFLLQNTFYSLVINVMIYFILIGIGMYRTIDKEDLVKIKMLIKKGNKK